MNLLSPERRDKLKELFLLGYSNRQIQSATGVSVNTILRYAKEFQAGVSCPCGRNAGHRGWCHWRYEFSSSRNQWMREKWKIRGQSDMQQRIAEALDAAKVHGHDPGPILWTSVLSCSLAYVKCRVCGALGYIKRGVTQNGSVLPDTYRDEARLTGGMFEKVCITPAEREQRRAAALEKRSWRKAKESLRALRSHLRNEESTPVPNSRP